MMILLIVVLYVEINERVVLWFFLVIFFFNCWIVVLCILMCVLIFFVLCLGFFGVFFVFVMRGKRIFVVIRVNNIMFVVRKIIRECFGKLLLLLSVYGIENVLVNVIVFCIFEIVIMLIEWGLGFRCLLFL